MDPKKSILDLIKSRRSCRKFKQDPVPDEDIMGVLEAAKWAPSGANSQPWKFIIIKNKETMEKIVESIPYKEFQNFLRLAPVLIVVLGNSKKKWHIIDLNFSKLYSIFMPILGINDEKCIKCMQCVLDCPTLLFDEDKTGKIVFSDPNKLCILCGHCISICPEDAILREKMEDVETFPNVENPEKLVSYKSLFQLFRSKRSIRQYKKDKVPQEVLQKVFNAMRYAPSGANRRAWKYFVISDSKKIKALSDAIIQEFSRNPTFQMMLGEKFKKKQERNIDPIFYNAPHIVILYTFEESQVDTGIAMTYGMLAAQTLGLGTCWIGFAKIAFDLNRQIKNLAGVKGRVSGVMTIGYPDVKYYRCPPRAPVKIKGLKKEVQQIIS